ncbi:MAG TPA: AtpZ/AtpI family protein [Bacteroidales bacterium]|nr:AtpZ/AtpI family protein [Bacteroidales bacterium]
MEEQQSQKNKIPKKTENKGIQDFAKYSSIAFQMIAIILVTTWGGIKLDTLFGFEKPVLTIILSLLGVFAAIYTAVRDFIK